MKNVHHKCTWGTQYTQKHSAAAQYLIPFEKGFSIDDRSPGPTFRRRQKSLDSQK